MQALLQRRFFNLCERRVHQRNRLQRQLQNPVFLLQCTR
jgi:hypothetical protein